MQLAAVSVLWQLDSDDCCSTTAAECCIDPTGLYQQGNPLTTLNVGAGFATPTYNPYASSLANLSTPIITQPAKPFSNTNLSGGVSSYSTPTTSRTDYLQSRIQEETARGNLLEANYVRQQLAVETAGRTGAYPDQALYQSYNVQVQRNAGAIQNALEYPQRKVLGALGTSPEELAAAAAYAGGDAYVPANRLVEVAPGIYRQPLVYAPELNPNYSKYRVGTGILSDPLTYLPAGVAATVNRGKAAKTLFSTGDELLDAARATSKTSTAIGSRYPANSGFFAEPKPTTLQPGLRFDRYGDPTGAFASPAGTPAAMRALPPGTASKTLHGYEVVKPIEGVNTGLTAPFYGQPGLGTQYQFPRPIQSYIDSGHILPIQ